MIILKSKFISTIIILILSCQVLLAQGQPGAPFLENQISPLLIGAGSIGSSIPTRDVAGHYYNPANLGYMAKEIGFSIIGMPEKAENNGGHYLANTLGFTLGHNFENSPFTFGFAYSRYSIDYSISGDETVNSFSFGSSLEYHLDFNIGFSFKVFNTNVDRTDEPSEKGIAFDFGTLIIVPISKLAFPNFSIEMAKKSISPYMNFSLGYSLSNLGNKIKYYSNNDPLPRTARTGFSLNFGFETNLENNSLKLFDYSFTAEAENSLVKSSSEYKSMFGDISYMKNVILLKPNGYVDIHKGHIFRLLETFIIVLGRINGQYTIDRKTSGIGISTEGLFKMLNIYINSDFTNYLSNHLVLEYYNTNDQYVNLQHDICSVRDGKTNYKGIALFFKNNIF